MVEVIQEERRTRSPFQRCSEEGCYYKVAENGKCGLHCETVNRETLRLLTDDHRLQLMSIPLNGWLPLYPHDAPRGVWEQMLGPILISRSALSRLEESGLVSNLIIQVGIGEYTSAFALTHRGRQVVDALHSLGWTRSRCYEQIHGHQWSDFDQESGKTRASKRRESLVGAA